MTTRRFESAALAAGLFFVLLACKKSEPAATADATPVAEPSAAPVATAAPTTEPVVTASASAAPTPTAVGTTHTVAKPKTDGGTVDAGAKKADSGTVASTGADAAAAPNADLQAIEACCRALDRNAQQPGLSQNQYKSAATACHGIAEKVKTGKADANKARTLIRAQLQGVQAPRQC